MPRRFLPSHRNLSRSASPRSAFTLIELLVVLAIIGILAAILFPVFAKVREGGRTAACSSNLKQLGLALQQYSQDAGGRMPGAAQYQRWEPGNGHWVAGIKDKPLASSTAPYAPTGDKANIERGALYSYVRDTGVYVCPSSAEGADKRLSYSLNCAVAGLGQSRIKDTSSIVLLVDEKFGNDGFFWASNQSASTDQLTDDHNGGGNLLFVDGHVKFYGRDGFNLDDTTTGQTLKWAGTKVANLPTSGTPRFHDPAFGPEGSAYTGGPLDNCATSVGAATPNPSPAPNPNPAPNPPAPGI